MLGPYQGQGHPEHLGLRTPGGLFRPVPDACRDRLTTPRSLARAIVPMPTVIATSAIIALGIVRSCILTSTPTSRNAAMPTDSESAITLTLRLCRGTCYYRRGVNRDAREGTAVLWTTALHFVEKLQLKDGAIHDTLPLFRERGGQELPCPKGARRSRRTSSGRPHCPPPAIVRLGGAGVNGARLWPQLGAAAPKPKAA